MAETEAEVGAGAEEDAVTTGDDGTVENAGSGRTEVDAMGTDKGVDGNDAVLAATPCVLWETSCGDAGNCGAATGVMTPVEDSD